MILTICLWLQLVLWWWKKILKIFIHLINPSISSQQWGHEWWLKGLNSVSQPINHTYQIYRPLRLFKDLKKMFMIKDFTKSLLTNMIYKGTKEEVISIKIQWMKRIIFCKIITKNGYSVHSIQKLKVKIIMI